MTTLLLAQSIAAFPANQSDIAQALHWHSGTSPNNCCSLCTGYYQEPKDIADITNPPPYKTTQIKISAAGPVIFRKNGESVLQKNVVITQPGRQIYADKAVVLRDKKSGAIKKILLSGHVQALEAGKRLLGKKAKFNVIKNIFEINHVIYHLSGMRHLPFMKKSFNAWGTATSVKHLPNNVMILNHATYSTCSPINPAWMMSAGKLTLDHTKGEAIARDVVLRIKKFPVMWIPYYSFATNMTRKSGLLTPSMGYASNHGFYFKQPIYWNISPNQDFLITPVWYQKRGILMNGLYRYLTKRSVGQLFVSGIYHDSEFNRFKQETLSSFSSKTLPSDLLPYISALKKADTNRGYLDFTNHTVYNKYWSSNIALLYVSDPYFARDFSSEQLNNNTNQLPSFAQLNYTGRHWNDTLLLQTYQTLHSLDHYTTPAQNQYTRLPELDVSASYPGILNHHLDLNLNAQYVYFDYHSLFYPYTYQRPIGSRFFIQPKLSHTFIWPGAYIKPALTLNSSSYLSEMPTNSATDHRTHFNKSRALPTVDLDSGLYFDRHMTLGHSRYIQTIEPRLFYLYTPYLNQDAYPNFDTQLLPFSFADLFSDNRFSGFDRVENANQLSAGLTSRIMSETDGHDVFDAQLGLIDYFSQPRVCLLPNCAPTHQSISPITGQLTFRPSNRWSLSSSLAWSTSLNQLNNIQIGSHYQIDNQHILLLSYQFIHASADTPFDSLGFSNDSSLITAGVLWPLSNRWKMFGYTYYNLSKHHPESEYGGVSYNTCCWALRLIVQNKYNGSTQVSGGTTAQNKYDTEYFIEFTLKGIGSDGNKSAQSMLSSTLSGYQDSFSKNVERYEYSSTI